MARVTTWTDPGRKQKQNRIGIYRGLIPGNSNRVTQVVLLRPGQMLQGLTSLLCVAWPKAVNRWRHWVHRVQAKGVAWMVDQVTEHRTEHRHSPLKHSQYAETSKNRDNRDRTEMEQRQDRQNRDGTVFIIVIVIIKTSILMTIVIGVHYF